jgi:hypothetical protein
MTREIKEVTSVSVYLKNGERWEYKDIPIQPTGEYEKVISFFDDDNLIVYPLDQVEKYIFHVNF